MLLRLSGAHIMNYWIPLSENKVFKKGSVSYMGRYDRQGTAFTLKIPRFSWKGLGVGEGENFFSREKKFSPSPRTIYPYREQRV